MLLFRAQASAGHWRCCRLHLRRYRSTTPGSALSICAYLAVVGRLLLKLYRQGISQGAQLPPEGLARERVDLAEVLEEVPLGSALARRYPGAHRQSNW